MFCVILTSVTKNFKLLKGAERRTIMRHMTITFTTETRNNRGMIVRRLFS
jgi:hypothetical protein